MDFKEKRAIVNSAFCSGIASVMPSATVPDWLKLTHNPEVFAHFKTSIKIFITIRRNISDYVRYVIRNVHRFWTFIIHFLPTTSVPIRLFFHWFCLNSRVFRKKMDFSSKLKGNSNTTLQSVMNAKLSKHRFWHCHENGLIKTIQTIPHNLSVSVKSASLYWGLGYTKDALWIIPNPQ